ncbi:MAG: GrpB family protein [Candidatus Zambryskibacteria bacterium]|nr:GrpB family protein [Candidatus Zambryskibacteria bacterium]
MLTEGQTKYLATVPDDQKMVVKSFNPRGLEIAEEIISSIKAVEPELEVMLLGSLALKILGQEDIDISAYCIKSEQPKHIDNFKKLFGEPSRQTANSIGWSFEREGFSVDVWLTDPTSETTKAQREVFNLLKNNRELLKEYENIKEETKDLTYKQYQTKKYEFFNRILGIS